MSMPLPPAARAPRVFGAQVFRAALFCRQPYFTTPRVVTRRALRAYLQQALLPRYRICAYAAFLLQSAMPLRKERD